MSVQLFPLPNAAGIASRILRLPAGTAGQVLCALDANGQPVPLCELPAPVPALESTDDLPEGQANLYYTDDRTDTRLVQFFNENYFEYLGFSPAAFPFSAGQPNVANPRTRSEFADVVGVAVSADMELPVTSSLVSQADYGTMVEFYYPLRPGGTGVVTLNFVGGATVNGQSSLQLWPGDLVTVAREAVGPVPATRKNFSIVRATNNRFTGQASVGFIPNTSEPDKPTGGGVRYVEAGALKYKGSNGTVTVLAPA